MIILVGMIISQLRIVIFYQPLGDWFAWLLTAMK